METNISKRDFSKLGFRMLFAAVAVYGVQIASQLVVMGVNPDLIYDMNLMLAATMIPMYAVGFPVAFMIMRTKDEVMIEKHRMKPYQFLMAFAMCYTLMMAGNIIGIVLTMGIGILKGEPVDNSLLDIVSNGNIWISAIYMVLLAPIFEEYLFRKLICARMLKYGQGMAVVMSGLIFGLFHANFNQFFYAFFLGCFFAFIYVKTGCLKYTIGLHMMVNFVGSVVGGLLLQNIDLENITLSGMMIYGIYAVCLFSVVITGAVLFLANLTKFKVAPGEIAVEKGRRFDTAVMNAGMILYCALFLIWMIVQALL